MGHNQSVDRGPDEHPRMTTPTTEQSDGPPVYKQPTHIMFVGYELVLKQYGLGDKRCESALRHSIRLLLTTRASLQSNSGAYCSATDRNPEGLASVSPYRNKHPLDKHVQQKVGVGILHE